MTAARWDQVKALFQATVDRPPSERAAFLAAAVGGDDALRREVESLLELGQFGPGVHGPLAIPGHVTRAAFHRRGFRIGRFTRTRTLLTADAGYRTLPRHRSAGGRRDGRSVSRTRQQIESRCCAERCSQARSNSIPTAWRDSGARRRYSPR